MGRVARELLFQLRWALPVWLLGLVTNWWPNNRVTLRLRGFLFRPFLKRCGRGFAMGRGVTLLNPHNIEVGEFVYLADYVWLNGLAGITLEDEVILGPYVVMSSLTHCCRDGSFRRGGADGAPIRVGRGSWLAAHVSVRHGVTIGAGCLVAANAAVTKDVPAGCMAGGVPAKVIGPCTEAEPSFFSRSGWGPGP